eukprot:scaffold104741_cov51-Phaeocystis_antarctica.AAC.2
MSWMRIHEVLGPLDSPRCIRIRCVVAVHALQGRVRSAMDRNPSMLDRATIDPPLTTRPPPGEGANDTLRGAGPSWRSNTPAP